MKFGYARVSTTDQNLARQIDALQKAGCEKIYSEKISGKNMERPQLKEMLDTIHMNDQVVVLDLDRLGRNSADITEIMNTIIGKKATFNVLNLPSFDGIEDVNLRTLLNNLVIEIYKYQAEAERKKIRERQREGINLAKKRGVYQGRPPKYSEDSNDPQGRYVYKGVVEMLNQGKGASGIAKEFGISRQQVYNIKKRLA